MSRSPRVLPWLLGPALIVALGASGAHAADRLPLKLLDPRTGQSVTLQPGARALHVVFFATWCPPCLEELERLGEIEARWGKQGYRLVLVAVRARQSRERLVAFIEQERPPGELLFDVEGLAGQALEAVEVPTHVVFDAQGQVVTRGGSLMPKVEEAIRQLLTPKERPPRGGS